MTKAALARRSPAAKHPRRIVRAVLFIDRPRQSSKLTEARAVPKSSASERLRPFPHVVLPTRERITRRAATRQTPSDAIHDERVVLVLDLPADQHDGEIAIRPARPAFGLAGLAGMVPSRRPDWNALVQILGPGLLQLPKDLARLHDASGHIDQPAVAVAGESTKPLVGFLYCQDSEGGHDDPALIPPEPVSGQPGAEVPVTSFHPYSPPSHHPLEEVPCRTWPCTVRRISP